MGEICSYTPYPAKYTKNTWCLSSRPRGVARARRRGSSPGTPSWGGGIGCRTICGELIARRRHKEEADHTVLLATATGGICPAGEDHMDVTVKRVVNGDIKYIFVKSTCESIIRLKDGVESAWPDADDCTWLTNERISLLRVRLLTCNTRPFFRGYVAALAQASPNNGTILMSRYHKIAIVLYYKHEANLEEAIGTLQQIFALVCGDISGCTDVIRCAICSIRGEKTGNSGCRRR